MDVFQKLLEAAEHDGYVQWAISPEYEKIENKKLA